MRYLAVSLLLFVTAPAWAGSHMLGTTGGSNFAQSPVAQANMQIWGLPTNCSGAQCNVKSSIQFTNSAGAFFRAGLMWSSILCPTGQVAAVYEGTYHAPTVLGCIAKTSAVTVKLAYSPNVIPNPFAGQLNPTWKVNGVTVFSTMLAGTGLAEHHSVKCPAKIEVYHAAGVPNPSYVGANINTITCSAPGSTYSHSPVGTPYPASWNSAASFAAAH